MALTSMTGFARVDGRCDIAAWTWELRAVNGRGLDVRYRLAAGLEHLEPKLRERLAARVTRGSVSANLTLTRATGGTQIQLNASALAQAHTAAKAAEAATGLTLQSLDTLLGLRGVLEIVEPRDDEATLAQRDAAILQSFDEALAAFCATRTGEGQRLAVVLSDQLSQIERLVRQAEHAPERAIDAITARLAAQIARLSPSDHGLDPQRLHQEAMVLATRADIAEELARLHAHVAAARALIAAAEPTGRKLDFLAQEFNREANTLCAKANDIALTRIGLDLKAVIDQFREQVQNIE